MMNYIPTWGTIHHIQIVHHIISAGWPPPSPETVHSEPHGLPMPPSEGLGIRLGWDWRKVNFTLFYGGLTWDLI